MTLEGWVELLERVGLIDVRAVDFTEEVGGMWEWFIGELGLRKAVKMMFGLLLRPSLLRDGVC